MLVNEGGRLARDWPSIIQIDTILSGEGMDSRKEYDLKINTLNPLFIVLALPFEVPTLGVVAYGVVTWTQKKKGVNRDQHSRDQHSRDQRARSGGLWSGGLDPKRGANRDQHSRDQRGRWLFEAWGIVMIPHRPKLALPFEVPTLGVVAYGVVAWTQKKKGANRDQHSRDQRARSGGLWSGGLDPKRGANRDQHSRDLFKGWGIVMISHRPKYGNWLWFIRLGVPPSNKASAALSNTGIPKVNVASATPSDEQPEVDVSDEEFLQFDTTAVPVIVTLTKVGRHYIVDATSEEESQMSSAVSVSINRQGLICGLTKRGGAGLDPSVILDMISVAKHVSEQLMNKLDSEIAAAEAMEEES
ncbi:exosome complex component RRP42 [Tanacetum coccineum]